MDRLTKDDFDELVALLKPELEKAKKAISGKQILSVWNFEGNITNVG